MHVDKVVDDDRRPSLPPMPNKYKKKSWVAYDDGPKRDDDDQQANYNFSVFILYSHLVFSSSHHEKLTIDCTKRARAIS